jgi:nitroreductase
MTEQRPGERVPEWDVDEMFIDRWSPRSFVDEPIRDEHAHSLFEAARWAPSCYNDQPWLFVYATSEEGRARFLSTLSEGNQRWARNAPLLAYVTARRRFRHNQKENRHAAFDAGAAWVSVAFQARKLGLYAHGMAGFRKEEAYELLGLDEEEYDILAAIAVGRRGRVDALPENLQKGEKPSNRKPHSEVARAL